MALCIHFVQCGVGDAVKGYRLVCLLEAGGGRDLSRVIWRMAPFVRHLVHMEGKECTNL